MTDLAARLATAMSDPALLFGGLLVCVLLLTWCGLAALMDRTPETRAWADRWAARLFR